MVAAVRVAVWAFAFTLAWGLVLALAQAQQTGSGLRFAGVFVVAVLAFVFASLTWSRLGRRRV